MQTFRIRAHCGIALEADVSTGISSTKTKEFNDFNLQFSVIRDLVTVSAD